MTFSSARLLGLLTVGLFACSNEMRATPSPAATGAGATGGTSAAGMGNGAAAGASGSGGSGGLSCEGATPGVAPLRLLTHVQYDNTVADLLGDTTHPAAGFPAENEVNGYRNNVAGNRVNPRLAEGYQSAAESLATTAVTTRLNDLAPCAAGSDNAACGHGFIQSFGAKAFRRALTDGEAGVFGTLFDATLAQQGYSKAVELTLRAMLQSPQFLYRVDSLKAATPETGAIALGPSELASRLSYFLTNSTPDPTLLAAAAGNQLASESEVEAQARRLLETTRAREMSQDFVGQWLGLARLDGAARVSSFGATELVPDWKASFAAFFEDAVWNDGTVSALLTSPKLFLSDKLANLYAMPPASSPGAAQSAPTQRSGILTQPAIMALLAHAEQSAPTLRGVFVRERLLCMEVDPPPPDVAAVPPDVNQAGTTRERFAEHTVNTRCAGCHVLLDGIGFGFEHYDQVGRYRDMDANAPVDATGEVVDSEDASLDGPFDGALELGQKLAQNSKVRDCVATQWYRYAMGRVEDTSDQCSLTDVKARFAASNGQFRELLVAISLSDAFRYRPAVVSP